MADATFRLTSNVIVNDYKLLTMTNKTAAESLKLKIVGAVRYEQWEGDWRWSYGDYKGGPGFALSRLPDSYTNDNPQWDSTSTGYTLNADLAPGDSTGIQMDPNQVYLTAQASQTHPSAYDKDDHGLSYEVGYDLRAEGLTIYGSPTAGSFDDALASVKNFINIVADPFQWADDKGRRVAFPKGYASNNTTHNYNLRRITYNLNAQIIIMPVCVVTIDTGLNDNQTVKVTIPGIGEHDYKVRNGQIIVGVPRIAPRMDLDPMTRVNLLAVNFYGNHAYNWNIPTLNINLDGNGPADVTTFTEIQNTQLTLEAGSVQRTLTVNALGDDWHTSVNFGAGNDGGGNADYLDQSVPDSSADGYGDPMSTDYNNDVTNTTTDNKPEIYLPPRVGSGSIQTVQQGQLIYSSMWLAKVDKYGVNLIGNGGVDLTTGEIKLTSSTENQIIGRV